jgi:hypothetical protein
MDTAWRTLRLTWTEEYEGHWIGRHPILRNPVEIDYDASLGSEAPYFIQAAGIDYRRGTGGPYKTLAIAKRAAAHLASRADRKG